ncbi:MAG TPA: ATP-binding cassette domain-containing protein, partial [Gemmatimonadales bacterium]|nr:ATP-binding cassette domain-containing protein [Gemmatimonadales bacterium]
MRRFGAGTSHPLPNPHRTPMMRKALMALAVVGLLTSCVSKKKYDELVLEQSRINEQKDSLVSDVLAATQMVTEINADLARVEGLGVSPVAAGERPATGRAEDRAVLLGKVREVISRLEAANQQIEEQKQRIGSMTTERRRLVAQLESFQGTIEELRATALQQESMITQQREEIRTLAGRVDTLDVDDLWKLSSGRIDKFRLDHCGFIFQGFNLFPSLTALQQVEVVLKFQGLSKGDAKRRARLALEEVGLGPRLHQRPSALSGGEKQRVAIARALA